LKGDRRQGLIFSLDRHPLLGFDSLMQTVRPTPAGHGAAGKLIDDDHLAVAHDVFDILVKQGVRSQTGVEMVEHAEVGGVVQAFVALQQTAFHQQILDPLVAVLGQINLLGFLIDPVVARPFFFFLTGQLRHDFIHPAIKVRAFLGWAGDDQRRARLVDQDRIHLVHQRVMERPLHLLLQAEGHVVAQIVEAVFVIGPISDVRTVSRPLLLGAHSGDHHPDAATTTPTLIPRKL